MASLLKLIYGLVFVYATLLGLLYFFQRSFIYFPSVDRPTFIQHGQAAQGFEVITTQTSDGLTLEGWYHPAPNADMPTLLWFHGNASDHGNRVYWARHYIEKGYGVVLAGYRGYGGNPGDPSEAGFMTDARAWVRTVQNNMNASYKKLVLYGESLGTGVAVQMATEFNASALILHTPYKSLRAIAQRQYPIFPVGLLMKDQFDSLSLIKDINMPVFMVHGTRDEVIPYAHAEELYETALEPKGFYSLDGARHSDIYQYDTADQVHAFLQKIENVALQ